MTKCIICERRPARTVGFCLQCHSELDADKVRKANDKPKHFLTYQGHVVGLYSDGHGKLTGQLLGRNAEKLPKGRTLDLNTYLKGYTRDTIKRFKACVLSFAHA